MAVLVLLVLMRVLALVVMAVLEQRLILLGDMRQTLDKMLETHIIMQVVEVQVVVVLVELVAEVLLVILEQVELQIQAAVAVEELQVQVIRQVQAAPA